MSASMNPAQNPPVNASGAVGHGYQVDLHTMETRVCPQCHSADIAHVAYVLVNDVTHVRTQPTIDCLGCGERDIDPIAAHRPTDVASDDQDYKTTRAYRAAKARAALAAYNGAAAETTEEALVDLLTDLMHLIDVEPGICDTYGDFEAMLTCAYGHYAQENPDRSPRRTPTL